MYCYAMLCIFLIQGLYFSIANIFMLSFHEENYNFSVVSFNFLLFSFISVVPISLAWSQWCIPVEKRTIHCTSRWECVAFFPIISYTLGIGITIPIPHHTYGCLTDLAFPICNLSFLMTSPSRYVIWVFLIYFTLPYFSHSLYFSYFSMIT